MTYTLITKSGKVLVFTVKACAELYQQAYGGVLLSTGVLEEKSCILPV
jgi:hypothetical protein